MCINQTQYFDGVPREMWEFRTGGYRVCEKWLKDRRGRRLTDDGLKHGQRIVVALAETIRLMREIDEGIPGWPLPQAERPEAQPQRRNPRATQRRPEGKGLRTRAGVPDAGGRGTRRQSGTDHRSMSK